MEDFCYAGGLPAVMRELGAGAEQRRGDRQRQHDLGQHEGRRSYDLEGRKRVIMPLDEPFKAKAGIAVLRGNLAPDGAVIKPSAATPALMKHKGRAVVFEDIDDFHARSRTNRSTSTPMTSWC